MSQRLLKSVTTVSGMTLLSRILGFVRDVVFAFMFGASGAFDAYVIAMKIPNFLRRLFAEGAFSQAFVPVLSEQLVGKERSQSIEFIAKMLGMLGFCVFIVVLIVECVTPGVITIFAPGFLRQPDKFQLATHLLRITFPYLLLISITALLGSVLNALHRFTLPAFVPCLLNMSLIGVSLLWAPSAAEPIHVLAWGMLLGGLAQLLALAWGVRRLGYLSWPRIVWSDPLVRRVLGLMVPALFGVSVAQLGLLIDGFFASFLPSGSISWLYYSDRLTYLPLGVIGVALATVVLPHLSRHHAQESDLEFSRVLDWGLRCVILVGVPAAVGLCVLSGPILVTLIQHGSFTTFDVTMTQRSLCAFALGLPAFMLVKVLASAFYAKQNIKTPVKVAAVALTINVILNVLLIGPLAHAGLALSTSVASWFNAVCLLLLLKRQRVYQAVTVWQRLVAQVVWANVMMALVLWWLSPTMAQWGDQSVWINALSLLGLIALGVCVNAACLYSVGVRWHLLTAGHISSTKECDVP